MNRQLREDRPRHMNRRKPNFAPAKLTRLTKATLADLLWHFATLDATETEESAWSAIEHGAKQIGKMPAQDTLELRGLAKSRRSKALAFWPRSFEPTVQDTIETRAARVLEGFGLAGMSGPERKRLSAAVGAFLGVYQGAKR